MFKLLLPPPLPPVHSQTRFGTMVKGIGRQGYIYNFSAYLCGCSRRVISMPCTCLPYYFPCVAPPFILSSSVQKSPFSLSFSHRGCLAERAQQQTSDLLWPSISYPETLISSSFPISRKTYSCSHPRFKTLLWNIKGSIRLFKGLDACFIFGSRVYGEQE